jgi:iron(III) transport system substrate-binding protein
LLHSFTAAARAAAFGVLASALALPASAQDRPWLEPKLLEAAKKEGTLVVYGSMNEEEALPYYKIFEDATGIKVSYVRASDTGIIGRIAIEHRAKQHSWDIAMTTPVNRLPDEVLAQVDPPQAKGLIPQARDPNRRWYGVYSNYNTPAYNTKFVKREQLPKTYEEFALRKEWAGKVAIDKADTEWVMAMYQHYGEAKGRKIIQDIVAALNPVTTEGHLALARSIAAGEYWVALNNYTNLTVNVKLAGAPTDYWALDPVALIFGSVGVAANSSRPNAARLLVNFVLSREAQTQLTKRGRIPTRPDTPSNPPDVNETLLKQKVIPAVFSAAEQKRWQAEFSKLFRSK